MSNTTFVGVTSGSGESATEFVQGIARELGRPVSADVASYILWEHTGFLGFFDIPADGATALECLAKQVRAFFAANPVAL